jgi:hypothetical protein
MSEDQRRNEETEVEGHAKLAADEQTDEENDVEAHVRHASVRMDSPSTI